MTVATTTNKQNLPWKVRFFTSLLSALIDASRRSNDTINRRLLNFLDRKVSPHSANGVSSSDVSVDPTRNLWFRLFVPSSATSAAAASLPVIIYFHGGGFGFMSPASIPYDAVCRMFCSSLSAIVVSVNYRLAPEHRFPSQYDDGFDVLKFLDQNGAVLRDSADVTRCFLAGDSAGGNLAHHVAVRFAREKLRVVNVIGLISIQPFFGGEERTESEIRLKRVPVVSMDRTDWFWKMFLPVGSNRDHEAVNVCGPNAVDISDVDYPNTLCVWVDWTRYKIGKGSIMSG
ncbi:Alpha/Beta hydrolase fold [Sesbania bispinosa]|nr:Alpha/Beta hydrolase fold [Sesbania bispinosa]